MEQDNSGILKINFLKGDRIIGNMLSKLNEKYCVVRLSTIKECTYPKGGKTPLWNQTIELTLDYPEFDIIIEVWERSLLSGDILLGMVEKVALQEVYISSKVPAKWYSIISTKGAYAGKVELELNWTYYRSLNRPKNESIPISESIHSTSNTRISIQPSIQSNRNSIISMQPSIQSNSNPRISIQPEHSTCPPSPSISSTSSIGRKPIQSPSTTPNTSQPFQKFIVPSFETLKPNDTKSSAPLSYTNSSDRVETNVFEAYVIPNFDTINPYEQHANNIDNQTTLDNQSIKNDLLKKSVVKHDLGSQELHVPTKIQRTNPSVPVVGQTFGGYDPNATLYTNPYNSIHFENQSSPLHQSYQSQHHQLYQQSTVIPHPYQEQMYKVQHNFQYSQKYSQHYDTQIHQPGVNSVIQNQQSHQSLSQSEKYPSQQQYQKAFHHFKGI